MTEQSLDAARAKARAILVVAAVRPSDVDPVLVAWALELMRENPEPTAAKETQCRADQ